MLDAKGVPLPRAPRSDRVEPRTPQGGDGGADSTLDTYQEGRDSNKDDGGKKFMTVFKKAHMEIASQLCRQTPTVANVDQGAGVGAMDDAPEPVNQAPMDPDAQGDKDDDGAPIEIGIVEEPVDENVGQNIETKLAKLLQEMEHPAEEIWLDAVVTVLESAGTLEKLQKFFLPMPMIFPKKVQEWGNFSQKKIKMERRLDLFLKWLQEETKVKHYQFLKESASSKERVLKQQSLVLTDYLEHLDEQILKLDDEIKVLERRNSEMRAHVSPLL